ncbi:MAG TPA: LON peptidase substrate-binding domain-containing protein [Rhodospirillales bacterium]|jgi:hypothetical protein|nr:LON peptidase substrate-binding domain-containing protein [Rhodospirillales bacterium]HJO69587.1 LON peptidase substrate-binding domain-containing protein [Rhodospirillales bacterium]
MSADRHRLPDTLPLFPLRGVIVLARARLPLNVFEPRYLNMTADALGNMRMIGMIQPRRHTSGPIGDDDELFDVGCAGRITAFSETDDGRFLITLMGVSRFRIGRELEMVRGYRRAAVDYDSFTDDLAADQNPILDRPGLVGAMRAYFSRMGIEARFDAFEAAADEALVTTLAMVCPFSPGEKQALLEAAFVPDRASMLVGLMEMALGEAGHQAGDARH